MVRRGKYIGSSFFQIKRSSVRKKHFEGYLQWNLEFLSPILGTYSAVSYSNLVCESASHLPYKITSSFREVPMERTPGWCYKPHLSLRSQNDRSNFLFCIQEGCTNVCVSALSQWSMFFSSEATKEGNIPFLFHIMKALL